MTDTLFPITAAPAALTTRQQHALDIIRRHPTGITGSDIGADLHLETHCRYCTTTEPCKYAGSDGNELARTLLAKGHVERRQHGRYVAAGTPRDGPATTAAPPGYDPRTAAIPF